MAKKRVVKEKTVRTKSGNVQRGGASLKMAEHVEYNGKKYYVTKEEYSFGKYFEPKICKMLSITHAGIVDMTDLKGLEEIKDLEVLVLSFNNISEIKGLEDLINLEALMLFKNNIKEIGGIGTLKNLKIIRLGRNPVFKNLKKMNLCQDNWSYGLFYDLKDLIAHVYEREKDIIESKRKKEDTKIKPDNKDLINYLKNLPRIYERVNINNISQKKAVDLNTLSNILEELILEGKLNAKIIGDELVFLVAGITEAPKAVSEPIPKTGGVAKESIPNSFEGIVYGKMNDTGYLDLAMIADKVGVSTDNVIRIIYRMISDFDGDIEGDKFKPLSDVKLSSIEKLMQKLRE